MIQIRVGKQKKKEKKKIYTENKIGRYVQFLIEREDFLELVASWLLSIEDERMQLLRQFIFEVELSETEELKNVSLIEKTSYEVIVTNNIIFYLTKINNIWYITLIDKIETDCSK